MATNVTETISDLFVDDLYFSALDGSEEKTVDHHDQQEDFQVSDSKYAEELQFQEAVMASIVTSQSTNSTTTSAFAASSSQMITNIQASPDPEMVIVTEAGESSSLSFCEICVERKEADEMFTTESCNHTYCCECISKHVATKIYGSSTKVVVTCPGVNCKSVLEIGGCREVLPKEVVDLWEELLCQELIDESERFYCPYKDCSAMLLNENDGDQVMVVEAECPLCHRLFCARCCVPWHSGVECEEFQRLNEDERGREDLMVVELAKDKKWGRCPHCKFYVERTEGCPHITCRCNFQFCYGCGSEWTNNHGGCHRE